MFRLLCGVRPPRAGFDFAIALALVVFMGAIASVVLRGNGQDPATPTEPQTTGNQDAAEAVDVESVEAAGTTNDPYAQPIAFSHQLHVAEMGIDCQMCHTYARRSPVAGIPSVQRCAQCHEQVLSEEPEVQKILEFWENEEPIPWVRVHDLPDHVRFSHKRHVLGGVNCAECHGDVSQMEAAVQVHSLSMGWCLNCHVEREASRDCLICHY